MRRRGCTHAKKRPTSPPWGSPKVLAASMARVSTDWLLPIHLLLSNQLLQDNYTLIKSCNYNKLMCNWANTSYLVNILIYNLLEKNNPQSVCNFEQQWKQYCRIRMQPCMQLQMKGDDTPIPAYTDCFLQVEIKPWAQEQNQKSKCYLQFTWSKSKNIVFIYT